MLNSGVVELKYFRVLHMYTQLLGMTKKIELIDVLSMECIVFDYEFETYEL